MTHAGRIKRILASAIVVGALSTGTSGAEGTQTASPVKWDPVASAELVQALHHMHHVWASGDIKALKALIPGDDQLVTYELAPAGHKPIRLKGKQDLDRFVDDVNSFVASEKATSRFDEPVVNCKATGTFGVCTEECTIHITKEDGSERVDRLWSTTVAVKYPDGWKWIQWHMSVGTPSQYVKPVAAASLSH
jgi:ketosteroid isomerase-like protein